MDSGLALRAPRNDDEVGIRLSSIFQTADTALHSRGAVRVRV